MIFLSFVVNLYKHRKEVVVMISALEKGQGLLEYALIMILVVVIVIVVLALLGPQVGKMFSSVVPLL